MPEPENKASVSVGTEIKPDKPEVIPGTNIVKDAKPDSENIGEKDDRYDFEFKYLKSQRSGEQKVETVPSKEEVKEPPEKTVSEKPSEEKPPVKAGEPPSKEQQPDEFKKLDQRYRDLQSMHDTKIGERDTRIKQLEAEAEQLKSVKVALDEFQKEPLVFLSRHFPDLADKVDQRKYILAKLKKEFGDEFEYNANEAYKEGTPSYKYKAREDELQFQLQQERLKQQSERTEATRKTEALLNDSKKRVMDRFKLTDAAFRAEIEDFSKGFTWDWEKIALIKYHDKIVQDAANQAVESYKKEKTTQDQGGATSPANIGGKTDEGLPQHVKEFRDAFGDI